MTVLTETTKTATVLNAHGENGVWKKTKSHTNNRNGELNTRGYNEKRDHQRLEENPEDIKRVS